MGYILPAIVAAAAGVALGMLWYGPFFGKKWMKLAKMKKKDMKPSATPMVFGFLRTLIMAFVVIAVLEKIPTADAILTVVVLWLGFTAMPAISDVLWAKKPFALYAINACYELVSLIVMTLILTTWL